MSDQIRTISRSQACVGPPRSVVTLATRLHVQLEMLHLQGHLVKLVLAPGSLSAEYPVSM